MLQKGIKMGKSSSKSKQSNVYGTTTTTNPYVTSSTNNSGTNTYFNKGTAFDTINNFVNSNVGSLLDQYLNPSLNSVTNQAKLNNFTETLNAQTARNLENNIINPLSNRNMIRSSQATNMYDNLARNNSNSIANYVNELLSTSQEDTANVLTNLLSLYLNGYNVISGNQAQSLQTSQGNASRTQNNSSTSISANDIAALAKLMSGKVL